MHVNEIQVRTEQILEVKDGKDTGKSGSAGIGIVDEAYNVRMDGLRI